MTNTENTPTVLARSSRPTVGLVAGGLGAYWPQFPDLLPKLRSSTEFVARRLGTFDADVVDVGFISDATEAAAAGDRLRGSNCDLIVMFLTTYMTATMGVRNRRWSWHFKLRATRWP